MGVPVLTPTPLDTVGVLQLPLVTTIDVCGNRVKGFTHTHCIRVTNESAGSIDVIIASQADGVDDITVTVAATTGDETIAIYNESEPVSLADYIDLDGYLNIDYDGEVTTDIKIGVFYVPTY
jgi:hypothetical protein